MIKSKRDYLDFLELDRLSRGEIRKRPKFLRDEIWRFQRLLRKVEYYMNTKRSVFSKVYLLFLKNKLYRQQIRLGIYITPNVFDSGLCILHAGGIIVNGKAKVGKNCKILHGTTIGTTRWSAGVPVIGNNVLLAAGAKVLGGVSLADNIAVGANAVVTKSFDEPGITIAGIPAKKINNKGIEGIIPTDIAL